MADDFDPMQMSDQELLSLPESNVPSAKLELFLSLRSALERKRIEDLVGENMPGRDGSRRTGHKPQDEEQEETEFTLLQYVSAMDDLGVREDRLFQEVLEEHRQTLQRLQEIDDRAIKLHDGRRAYVDGDNYRDRAGDYMRSADKDEADRLKTGTSSTWAEKSEYENKKDAEARLLRDMEQDKEKLDANRNGAENLTGHERAARLAEEEAIAARHEKEAADLANTYSSDYGGTKGTGAAQRTASYAGTLDAEPDQRTIGREFTSASRAANPSENPRPPAAAPPAASPVIRP